MKKTILILTANIFLIVMSFVAASAQSGKIIHKSIQIKENNQIEIEGNVAGGKQVSYDFKATAEANVSIILISKSAEFQIGVIDLEEPMRITEWVKSFEGKLYPSDEGQYSIIIRSKIKSAAFRLKILVK